MCIHSSIQSFNHSSIHSFIHSFFHSFIYSSKHFCVHLFIHSFIPSFIHSFRHSFNLLLLYFCIHSAFLCSLMQLYSSNIHLFFPSYKSFFSLHLSAIFFSPPSLLFLPV